MSDPVDTLRVRGGRPLGTADAEAVRVAADLSGRAQTVLARAVAACASAAFALDRQAGPAGFADAGISVGAWHALSADVRARAGRLAAASEECGLLRDRLTRAAGLYDETESWVNAAVGKVVGGPATVAVVVAEALPESARTRAVTRAAAPWTDEGTAAIAGLLPMIATSVLPPAVGAPLRSRIASMPDTAKVTLGAAMLSMAAEPFRGDTTVRVREMRPTGAGAGWDASPSDTIDSALARIPQLTGSGMAPGDEEAGVPAATLAIEQVTHDDGTTTWTVVIPGTQDYVSAEHPFDGLSDIDLMGHRAADISAAIGDALAQAGARPDEKVVLVGHSLGGIVAMSLASSAEFRARHAIGGVVTAGSPTASFPVPAGIPVLNLENDEELVSNTDGASGGENPAGIDRVTVSRSLGASSSPHDLAAAGAVFAAHGIRTHRRTLALAQQSRNAQVLGVVGRIEAQLRGTHTRTRFYTARRTEAAPAGAAPGPHPGRTPTPDASSERTPR